MVAAAVVAAGGGAAVLALLGLHQGWVIHNVLFRISMHGLFVTLDPTNFQVTCDYSYFSSFEYYVQMNSYHKVLFSMKIRPC